MASPKIFIFDSTRLRSHLFFRYISTHPALTPIYHPFLMATMFGKELIGQKLKHSQERAEELKQHEAMGNGETYESSASDFKVRTEELEREGKGWVSNEHWFNVFRQELVVKLVRGDGGTDGWGDNPTWIPDGIFQEVQPIILIRHPALSVRSIHRDALKFTKTRLGDEDLDMIIQNHALRSLFDFFNERGRQSVIIDAEDLLWRTEELRKSLCGRLGIDPDGLRDRWEPTSKEEVERMNPVVYGLTKNIHDSCGIERPGVRPEEPTIEGMREWWREQYGEEEARKLVEAAERNMEDYAYLRGFKV